MQGAPSALLLLQRPTTAPLLHHVFAASGLQLATSAHLAADTASVRRRLMAGSCCISAGCGGGAVKEMGRKISAAGHSICIHARRRFQLANS